MIKLKELLSEAKRHPKFGKLVATITRGNDQIWELYSDVRWGGYVTPIIVYKDGRNDKGKEIDQFGPNMYTKPAIKKFEKKYGGGYAKAKIA